MDYCKQTKDALIKKRAEALESLCFYATLINDKSNSKDEAVKYAEIKVNLYVALITLFDDTIAKLPC